MDDLAYTPHAGQMGWGGLMFAYLSLSRLLRHPREEWEWSYSALPEPQAQKWSEGQKISKFSYQSAY